LSRPSLPTRLGEVQAVVLVGVLLLPTLIGGALVGGARLWQRWCQRQSEARPIPLGPPIERIAADLRRLNGQRMVMQQQVRAPGRGVRARALTAAYVDVLTDACRVLEVAPPRAGTSGVAAPAEIQRVEAELLVRGLDVSRQAAV
jgi:hypothetical protein